MKRQATDPGNFYLLNSLDALAKAIGTQISDTTTSEALLQSHRDSLREHLNHGARLHGFHVQSMFAHVAAALGECLLITEEDSGSFFCASETMKRPDFRIVTRDESQMLVEVKNHFQKDTRKSYRFKGDYLRSLKRYASANGLTLRIAIYWARWNIWTLIDAGRLDDSRDVVEVAMADAFMHNEMHVLGDRMINAEPPLSFRVYADKTKPRQISDSGEFAFTVAKVCMCSAGRDIEDAFEQKLAWFLTMNGCWEDVQDNVKVSNGLLDFLEVRSAPPEPTDPEERHRRFHTIGFMSQMVTTQFRRLTTQNQKVTRLSPISQPSELGVLIPTDYDSSVLQLQICILHPKGTTAESIQKTRQRLASLNRPG